MLCKRCLAVLPQMPTPQVPHRPRVLVPAVEHDTELGRGGAVGVAVLGSILATAYRSDITQALSALPAPLRRTAGESIGATQLTARAAHRQLPGHGLPILQAASDAFINAIHTVTAVSAAAMLLAAAVVLAWMPAHRKAHAEALTTPKPALRVYGFATICACTSVCPSPGPGNTAAALPCACDPPPAPPLCGGEVMKPDTTAATAGGPPAVEPRRTAKGGIVGGLLGAICCMIGAIAVGAGLAGTSFATNLMDRYQIYALAASLVFLAWWLIHLARTSGIHLEDILHHGRRIARHLVVMASAYGITLGIAFGASIFIRNL